MADAHSRATAKTGARIAELRHQTNLSAKRIADCADMDLTHYQRIERGEGHPTLYTLVQIATALEVGVSELVDGVAANDLPSGREPYGYSQSVSRRNRRDLYG
ncbi:helix-turn-helix domain-containing protein [Microbacterium amylolyticum]|uniref:Transcriptional regulator with XRE-family HTH domain n=1 Tax=Microbacterium amylolyticum TaxID=936337 RepID=A0ABS4ZKH7_9MICO|nr:helix-turn-helix transcriptional regulator [Microbacterium amylolyticum]MBP2437797.1 transcriptional regulator with XRE-family HTH domain [Microbacterium amylolyticum]